MQRFSIYDRSDRLSFTAQYVFEWVIDEERSLWDVQHVKRATLRK